MPSIVEHPEYGVLNRDLLRVLHQGILKWVYKARNTVNWHDYGLSAPSSSKCTLSLRNFLTMGQLFSVTIFWTCDSRCGCKLSIVRLWLCKLGMAYVADRTSEIQRSCSFATAAWFQMSVPDICGVFMYLWLVNFGPVELLCQWIQIAYLFYQPVSRPTDYYYYCYYAHLLFLGTTFRLTPS
jgi:hypothetical protein